MRHRHGMVNGFKLVSPLLLHLFVFLAGTVLIQGWTSPRPVWFSPSTSSSLQTQPQQQQQQQQQLIVFLHGRLEAEPGEPPFAPPAELYGDFCTSVADALHLPVLLIDYHEVLASSLLSKEPRKWQWGQLTQYTVGKITEELDKHSTTNQSVILMTFSMGAALGLKLIAAGLGQWKISKFVLIEPVWRCWLSLVPRNTAISNVDTLVVWGTGDKDTLTDSGGNVTAVLQPLLPRLTAYILEGGNHWYILDSETLASMDLLTKGMTRNSVELRDELVQRIRNFCAQGKSSIDA